MRVIICDDEKSTCAEVENMLRDFAFEKCETGSECIF